MLTESRSCRSLGQASLKLLAIGVASVMVLMVAIAVTQSRHKDVARPPSSRPTVCKSGVPIAVAKLRSVPQLKSDADREFHEQWLAATTENSPERILSLMRSGKVIASEHLRYGLVPWVVFAEEGYPRAITPGGRCQISVSERWLDPPAGASASLSAPSLSPPWKVELTSAERGWWRTRDGGNLYFVLHTSWASLPEYSADSAVLTLSWSAQATGPRDGQGSEWTLRKAIELRIVLCPIPDREALFCLWGYAVGEGHSLFDNNKKEQRLWARGLLRSLSATLDSADRDLYNLLMNHPEYNKQSKEVGGS